MKIRLRAYAKINWTLRVCDERSDGYHSLDMLMQRIELCDELSFERARHLTLEVDGQRLPGGERNLVIRAANALNDAMGKHLGARITLKKCIPTRAGLGGGSADCAATLLALNRLWNLHLPLRTLEHLGLRLGADVPFCLHRGLFRAQGIGEVLTPLPAAPKLPLVLLTPGALSTPAVFRTWNEFGCPRGTADIPALANALTRGQLVRAQALSCNDLELPARALLPSVGQWLRRMHEMGAPFVRMSGSGASVFAVFPEDASARAFAAQIPGALFTHTLGDAGDGMGAIC